jgi:NAD(P)-dependent dehydrogenase (short-subunit alcohol dehydrogenase family)
MQFPSQKARSSAVGAAPASGVLIGKTAIVTGAGSGIGRGIATLFAREGANVVLADRNAEVGEKTTSEIEADGGNAIFLQGDVTNPDYHRHLVTLAKWTFGHLDIAINNAGISLPPTPVADISVETWDRIVSVDLSGVFYAVRAQIPAMLEAGGGTIVNIASAAGLVAMPGIGAYVAAKHGVVGLTKSVAVEYGQQGIRANAIAPGFIDTPLSRHFPPEQRARLAAYAPMNRLGSVDEVAMLALFLAGAASSFVTGAAIPIDGGTVAL